MCHSETQAGRRAAKASLQLLSGVLIVAAVPLKLNISVDTFSSVCVTFYKVETRTLRQKNKNNWAAIQTMLAVSFVGYSVI